MSETLVVESEECGPVQLEFAVVDVAWTRDDGTTETRSCRLVLAAKVGSEDLETVAVEDLDDWADEDEGDEWRLLVWLRVMVPNGDRRRIRQFDPRTFRRCESLKSLAGSPGVAGATLSERLLAIAGECGSGHDVALFDGAAFDRPLIRLPLPEGEYEEFRRLVFDEVRDIRAEFDRIVRSTVAEAIRTEASRNGKRATRKRRDEAADAIFGNADFWDRVGQDIRQVMGRVISETADREERQAERFGDLVERIDLIGTRLEEEMARRDGTPSAELRDGTVAASAGFLALLGEVLPVGTADELVGELLRRIEQDHGLAPLEVVAVDEFPDESVLADVEADESDDFDGSIRLAFVRYQWSLASALDDDDLLSKWSCLCRLRAQLVNRSECFRLLQRESETAYSAVYGAAAHGLFRRIRKHLTREERRAFLLFHTPNRWLNGRVPALEPLAWSFVGGMDGETLGLLFSALVLKAGDGSAGGDLGRRWNAFLRFYPFWLDMVRDDEREERRRRSDRFPTEPFSEATLRDRKANPPDLALQLAAVNSERLPEWAARYCTPAQARYLTAYYRDGLTEAEIGRAHGVTQQAVSKGVLDGMKRLRRGLRADRVVEFDDE